MFNHVPVCVTKQLEELNIVRSQSGQISNVACQVLLTMPTTFLRKATVRRYFGEEPRVLFAHSRRSFHHKSCRRPFEPRLL